MSSSPRRKRERLLRPAEVADLFDVEPMTAVDWAKTGKLAAIRTPGGHWRFRPSAIEALLASGTNNDPSTPAPAETLLDPEPAHP